MWTPLRTVKKKKYYTIILKYKIHAHTITQIENNQIVKIIQSLQLKGL